MSSTAVNEADGGGAADARVIERDLESGPIAVAGTQPAPMQPVEQIWALTADELEEVTQMFNPAARGLASAAFEKDGAGADWSVLGKPLALLPPPPDPERSALEPFYGEELANAPERAEVRIEDLSLDPSNPFVGSSLLPPPPKQRTWRKPVLVMASACLLVGAGYGGALLRLTQQQPIAAALAQPTAAPAALQPKAAAEAPEAEFAAPTQAVIQRPQAEAALEPVTKPVVSGAPRVRSAAAAAPRRRSRPAPPSAPRVTKPAAEVAPSAPPVRAAPVAASLSRNQVRAGLESTRAALQACAAGQPGDMMANVTISGAGRITYAFVEGTFAGTPQGSCMARALRAAQFPPFTSAAFRVRYPFVF